MKDGSLRVSEVLTRAQRAVVSEFPGPVWVRGEVTGFRRTSGGAAFFRLADPDVDGAALDAGARGRIMAEIDRVLSDTGVGGLRDGIEIRVRGTVGVAARSSIRLSVLEIDPEFTAGRLAIDRAAVIRRLTRDGALAANGRLQTPMVPLRVGLVTSRGSAAHGDFTDQLRRSNYRFALRTAHTIVQGEGTPERVAACLARVAEEPVDVIALVRGGGSKLDLAGFDTETVGRAISRAPVPVITGIGHEMDRTVADEAAAIAEKTPSAAGEWLVTRVRDFAERLDRARSHIRREGAEALRRSRHELTRVASDISGDTTTLHRQRDFLERMGDEIASSTRRALHEQRTLIASLGEWFSAIGLEPTLRRGFAIVTAGDGDTVIRSVDQIFPGDELSIRLSDGTVAVRVIER